MRNILLYIFSTVLFWGCSTRLSGDDYVSVSGEGYLLVGDSLKVELDRLSIIESESSVQLVVFGQDARLSREDGLEGRGAVLIVDIPIYNMVTGSKHFGYYQTFTIVDSLIRIAYDLSVDFDQELFVLPFRLNRFTSLQQATVVIRHVQDIYNIRLLGTLDGVQVAFEAQFVGYLYSYMFT